MPFNFTLLGTCLLAAVAAVAAEPSVDRGQEPWWTNPPTVTSSSSGAKITEYGRATPAASGSASRSTEARTAEVNPGETSPAEAKPAETRPADRGGQVAEFAPDPPGQRHSDTMQAAYYQDSGSDQSSPPAERPAERKSERGGQDAPPMQLPASTPLAAPLPPAKADVPPAPTSTPTPAATSPSAAGDSGSPLALGNHNDKNALAKKSPISAMITVGGSLAIVLGLFFVVAWAIRKTAPRGSLLLPKEVFEILGRAPLGARQQVQLLRCGSKLLLVSITPNGSETLTEVTDPLEVDRIAGVCQQGHPKSATVAFRQVFQQLAPGAPGGAPSTLGPGRGESAELDDLQPAGRRQRRYRWEERNA